MDKDSSSPFFGGGGGGSAKAVAPAPARTRFRSRSVGYTSKGEADVGFLKQVPGQLSSMADYLQDLDSRLLQRFQFLSDSVAAVHVRLEASLARPPPPPSRARTNTRHGTSSSGKSPSTGGMAPLIGRPAQSPEPMLRAPSRHHTGSSSVVSQAAVRAHSIEDIMGVRRPSDASILAYRRPSDASQFAAALHRRPSDSSQFPLPQRRPSDSGQVTAFQRRPSDSGLQPSQGTLTGLQRRPSADLNSVFTVSVSATPAAAPARRPSLETISLPQLLRPSCESSPFSSERPVRRPSIHSSDEVLRRLPTQHSVDTASSIDPSALHEQTGEDDATSGESSEEHEGSNGESPRHAIARRDAAWSLAPQASTANLDVSDYATPKSRSARSARISHRTRSSLNLELGLAEDKPPRFIIMPGSRLKLAWDVLVILATVAAAVLMPLGLVYLDEVEPGVVWLNEGVVGVILQLIDVLWIVDVIINFRTAFSNNGRIMSDPIQIATAYARSWLVLDLITACPVVLLPAAIAWVLRIFKLSRLLRVLHVLDKLQKELRWVPVLPAKVLLVTILPTHLLACAWRITHRADSSDEVGAEAVGAAKPWWTLYVEDTYWVMMTMTTVGYGDVGPSGLIGQGFAIFAMMLAPVFNGCIVSLLTHVTKGLFNDEVQMQVVEAARFMRQRHVPPELQRRVEHNLRCRLWQEHHLALAPSLLNKLSPSMQRELTLELLSSTVLNFPLFRMAPVAFIAEIAQAHSWVQCSSGDLVVEAGQLEQEVVFVVMGQLLSFKKERQQSISSTEPIWTPRLSSASGKAAGEEEVGNEVEISAGAWFGESCLFCEGHVRNTTVFANQDSELAVLQASDYHRIVKKYPLLSERHQAIQKQVQSDNLNLWDLAYTAPQQEMPRARRIWSLLFHPGTGTGRSSKVVDTESLTSVGTCPH